MPNTTRTVSPTGTPNTYRSESGELLKIPEDWALLPPGDAMLTRRVKSLGPHWVVQVKKGRRLMSAGVLAPARRIERIRGEVAAAKSTPEYKRKQVAAKKARDREQSAYVLEFKGEVLEFLAFHECHSELAGRIADAVTTHAAGVGSGTVARTKRISVSERAEAAVIAWMRHQTTSYDHMHIARERGARRKVRRQLAAKARALLDRYRKGESVAEGECPLRLALAK
ncbi:MAG: DUF2293 domain-containing protein [Myxococcales bacterium]|nr:DUF2293 domain-containing protein [Myxococcales bacterium]